MSHTPATDSALTKTLVVDGLRRYFLATYPSLLEDALGLLASTHSDAELKWNLVHNAYLRLVNGGRIEFDDLQHFRQEAGACMQQLLLEWRIQHAPPRFDAALQRLVLQRLLHERPIVHNTEVAELLRILDRLGRRHPKKAELVRLRYLAGLSRPETCGLLGISAAEEQRYWNYARAWLFRELYREAFPEAN